MIWNRHHKVAANRKKDIVPNLLGIKRVSKSPTLQRTLNPILIGNRALEKRKISKALIRGNRYTRESSSSSRMTWMRMRNLRAIPTMQSETAKKAENQRKTTKDQRYGNPTRTRRRKLEVVLVETINMTRKRRSLIDRQISRRSGRRGVRRTSQIKRVVKNPIKMRPKRKHSRTWISKVSGHLQRQRRRSLLVYQTIRIPPPAVSNSI